MIRRCHRRWRILSPQIESLNELKCFPFVAQKILQVLCRILLRQRIRI